VFAHLLNITNRTAHYVGLNRQGKWSQSEDFCYMDTTLTELSGKTMGIVGLGNIGSAVSRIAHAFGMNVLAYTSKTEVPSFIHKIDLGGLFHNSDVISLHCPLTDATLKMVNSQLLSTVKPGAILINTSRGQIIDELAVAEALRSGTLGAFAADVLSQEPPLITNPLQTAPNVFITPHIAWATQEARRRLLSICSDNIVAFLNGHPQNVVNP
jgi:glycerate dehydrogenase